MKNTKNNAKKGGSGGNKIPPFAMPNEPRLKVLREAGMVSDSAMGGADPTPEQEEAFMNGVPTRQEVTTFIAGMMNNVLLPDVQALIERNNAAIDAILIIFQTALIEKEIVSEEEWKERLERALKEMHEKSLIQQGQIVPEGEEADNGEPSENDKDEE